MAFRAFLDTCVLFSATLNDTLLRIAELGAFQPLWSQGVLRELRTVLQREAHISPDAAGRRIANMQRAFADADVSGYESLIPAMTCDGKDRHVLAATIRGNAELLITFNVKDFPASSTDPYNIVVRSPDDFLLDQLDLYPGIVNIALTLQCTEAQRPPMTINQLLARLKAAGVPEFARAFQTRQGIPTDIHLS
jgi:predicted nucleic acid-binding protein